ncbi:MAG: hypothetical protein IT350_17570 [Deltaproteobacteria bacterium]|nr:hypothetical protein [Deltaproteobacteria bacterium]
MAPVIHESTPREVEILDQIREEVDRELKRANKTPRDIADRLQMVPSGAEMLFAHQRWSLETAFRVAEALGIRIDVQLALSER